MNIKTTLSPTPEVKLKNLDNRLSDGCLNYLNSEACRNVNPCSRTFWKDMKNWLTHRYESASNYPKDVCYRKNLAPYIYQRVNLVSKGWTIKKVYPNKETVLITLTDVQIAFVCGHRLRKDSGMAAKHMHIRVNTSWLNRVKPDPASGLSIHGLLYEYVSCKNVRNIGIWPVALMPRSSRTSTLDSILPQEPQCDSL